MWIDLKVCRKTLQLSRGRLAQWKTVRFVNFCLRQTMVWNLRHSKSFGSANLFRKNVWHWSFAKCWRSLSLGKIGRIWKKLSSITQPLRERWKGRSPNKFAQSTLLCNSIATVSAIKINLRQRNRDDYINRPRRQGTLIG